ncbi:MAG: hypothetical protein KJ574_02075 [Nanoarchaeota archaeon]|nr:hypothetical protein [Nanoarchaeota archaeon]
MDLIRRAFDAFYTLIRPCVFSATRSDPEKAHELFSFLCRALQKTGLKKCVLDNSSNGIALPFELSNAAGMNKNGELHPLVLKYLGFDRIVVGSVTHLPCEGNQRPRCRRLDGIESMVNWMGLPGKGSSFVRNNLERCGDSSVPLTINVAATPGKKGDDMLLDLESTVVNLKELRNVDRFELNISCPNVYEDTRRTYQEMLPEIICAVEEKLLSHQGLYLKVSPDISLSQVDSLLSLAMDYRRVKGFTIGNTTRNIPGSAYFPECRGGGSGDIVYHPSFDVQQSFERLMAGNSRQFDILACGGISSVAKVKERITAHASGVQLYTALIYRGPGLLRDIRQQYGSDRQT